MIRALTLLIVAGQAAAAGAEVVRVGPWQMHSSFWMCLHQQLMHDATASAPRAQAGFATEERTAWNEAVAAYRAAAGGGDMSLAKPMLITSDALTQVADDAADLPDGAPLAQALRRAARVYRAHWWAADDRANRFFIGYAAAMLRDAGEELARLHERVYRTAWPARIRVYTAPAAGQFGAYTFTGLSGGVIVTMSSRDEGYQGVRALEMILHESSHAIVAPNGTTVGAAIAAAAKARGVAAPRDLWHAILFATSGELARRALADRGVTGFVPASVEVLTRAWPAYRQPIERFWIAYLDGEGTLESAIDAIVAAIP